MKKTSTYLWMALFAMVLLPVWWLMEAAEPGVGTNVVQTVTVAMTPTHPYAIPGWILILGLFLPRITLLVAYLGHNIPPNDLPFWGDFCLALFLPRLLMLIYIYGCMGLCVWFWVHLTVALIALVGMRVRMNTSKSE